MTDLNGADGRDRSGRFGRGNRYGRGNPNLARLAKAQAAIRGATTAKDVVAVLAALKAAALAGDTAAASAWLLRVLGRPREEPVIGNLRLPALDGPEDFRDAFAEIARAVASGAIPPDVAGRLGELVQRASDASVLIELRTRLERLEQVDEG